MSAKKKIDAAPSRRTAWGARAAAALVAAGLLLAWTVASAVVTRWRHRRLAHHAQQITITTPPEVETAGAAQFWTTAYGTLHRGWWRRPRGRRPRW